MLVVELEVLLHVALPQEFDYFWSVRCAGGYAYEARNLSTDTKVCGTLEKFRLVTMTNSVMWNIGTNTSVFQATVLKNVDSLWKKNKFVTPKGVAK